jgi:hypothetical protein
VSKVISRKLKFAIAILLIWFLVIHKNFICITTSGSDVNGIYLNLFTSLYSSIDNSGTLLDNNKLFTTSADHIKINKVSQALSLIGLESSTFTSYKRNQFVGFCLPSLEATQLAFKGYLSQICAYLVGLLF